MGGWVALCATAIMFYYSVVAGWCLRYLCASLDRRADGASSEALWERFAGTLAAGADPRRSRSHLGVAVVWFGVRGIERVAKVLIPTLFVLVVVLAIRAVTLPGAGARARVPVHTRLGGPGAARASGSRR